MNRIILSEQNVVNNYKDKWERFYQMYNNYVDIIIDPATQKQITTTSNISIPYAYIQVATILPRLVETLFSARPYITVKDREVNDYNFATNNQVLLDYQMNERMNLRSKFAEGLKTLCIYGTTIAYTGWKYDTRNIIKKQLVDIIDEETNQPFVDEVTRQPIQRYQPVKTKEILYDDPDVYFVDLLNFFVDPYAEDIDTARWCGHITYETKSEIQKKHDSEIYVVDWKKITSSNSYNKPKQERMASIGIAINNSSPNSEDDLYEVIHYWEDNRHVIIIERSYIAKDEENPYWHKKKPYDMSRYDSIPGEFYGKGVMDRIEPLIDELNTYRNMRIDYAAMSNRRMFKYKKGSGISKKDLTWRPNGLIPVNEMDDIEEIGVQNVSPQMFNQEETVKQDIMDATGAQSVIMGTSSRDTATGTMTKDSNASIRFKEIITSIEKDLLVNIARKMMQLNQQFLDTERVLRISNIKGDDWVNINPDEIQGEFDCIAMGSSVEPLANKEAYKQRLLQLYQISNTDPIFQAFPEKKLYLMKLIFQAFDMQNIDELIPTEEEVKAKQMQTAPATPNEQTLPENTLPQNDMQLPPDLMNQLMGMQNTENFSANASGGLNRSIMEGQGLLPE